jgi:hypothetical protein
VKEGSARRAERMGVPTDPVAPAMRTFLMGVDIFLDEVPCWSSYLSLIGFVLNAFSNFHRI